MIIIQKKEVNEKLEEKIDLEQFKNTFTICTLTQEINKLETTSKTIAGAINKINNKKINLDNYYTKEEIDIIFTNFRNEFNELFYMTANNEDINTLKTSKKTVVGAINELKDAINNLIIKNNGIWKEVGVKKTFNTITYDFKINTKYRIYYNYTNDFSQYTPWLITEFVYGDKKIMYTGKISYFKDPTSSSSQDLYLSFDRNTIFVNSSYRGSILKLEELQE